MMDFFGPIIVCGAFLLSAEGVYHYYFGNSLVMDIVRGFKNKED